MNCEECTGVTPAILIITTTFRSRNRQPNARTCMPVVRNKCDFLPESGALVLAEHVWVWSGRHNLLTAVLKNLPVLMDTRILWQLQLQRCLAGCHAEQSIPAPMPRSWHRRRALVAGPDIHQPEQLCRTQHNNGPWLVYTELYWAANTACIRASQTHPCSVALWWRFTCSNAAMPSLKQAQHNPGVHGSTHLKRLSA